MHICTTQFPLSPSNLSHQQRNMWNRLVTPKTGSATAGRVLVGQGRLSKARGALQRLGQLRLGSSHTPVSEPGGYLFGQPVRLPFRLKTECDPRGLTFTDTDGQDKEVVLVGAAVLLWVLRHHGRVPGPRVLLAPQRALVHLQEGGPQPTRRERRVPGMAPAPRLLARRHQDPKAVVHGGFLPKERSLI